MRFSQRSSVFLEHYFCRLYYDLNGITFLEGHFFCASPGDHALDDVFPNAHDDVCHNPTKLDFLDGSLELIASRKSHITSLIQLPRCWEAPWTIIHAPLRDFTDCPAPGNKDDSAFDIWD